MATVNETLQQLVERRLREMGARRGRSEPLSLLEVWQSLPETDGKRPVSYEIVRRIADGKHSNIGDRVADALATMLDVSGGDVLKAAGQRPRLGRFELPRRADRLTERERQAVITMVDAILDAAKTRDRVEAEMRPSVRRRAAAEEHVPESVIQKKRREARQNSDEVTERALTYYLEMQREQRHEA